MTQSSVVVRPVRADDAEAVAAAHVRAWQVGYREIMPASYLDAIDLDERVERWRGWLADEAFRRTRVVVAEVDGTVVGFAIHGAERDVTDTDEASDSEAPAELEAPEPRPTTGTTGELYALNVHPDHWGAGAGGALLEHVTAALANAGHRDAVLWVLRDNARARRFYARHGWAPDGTAKTETQDGVVLDEVRYRRTLAPGTAQSGGRR